MAPGRPPARSISRDVGGPAGVRDAPRLQEAAEEAEGTAGLLRELRVRGVGVIDDIAVTFGSGLTALTGETGAGKTLLVEALHLVLGGRASAGLVRAGEAEALVEARFEWDGTEQDAGCPGGGDGDAGGEIVLARSAGSGGRSKAWIDGRMVPIARLAEVGRELVDIYGQGDHQSLLAPAAQRRALDEHAGADPLPLQEARRQLKEIERLLEKAGGDADHRRREVDLLRYQLEEIEAASLHDPDEEEGLVAEEERLADMVALRLAAAEALGCLDGWSSNEGADAAPAATEMVGKAMAALGGRKVLEGWEQRLRSTMAELVDVASDLHKVLDTWQEDPSRLDEIQARRRLLGNLRRKYGPTLAEVMDFAERAGRDLAELEGLSERTSHLERRRSEVGRQLLAAAADLGKARRSGAPVLAAALSRRLADLAMADARIEVTVAGRGDEEDDRLAAGDDVEILLGANPGEPPQPLSRVASGGELARTMLALRLVAAGGPPTAIFDEVDAGVGGAAALALGRALAEASRRRQVIVVTHLPQVAACADHQVKLEKLVVEGRTTATATELDRAERVVELSRMLSGSPDSRTARAHAEELLATARGTGRSTTGRGAGG